ncbi:MAG: helix-turn-helix domain-containing protein [Planctomycetia bacterium]
MQLNVVTAEEHARLANRVGDLESLIRHLQDAVGLCQWLTPQQAAEVLGLCEWEVRDRCRTGEIPGAVQEGKRRHWKIPRTALTELVSRRRTRDPVPTPPAPGSSGGSGGAVLPSSAPPTSR